MAPPSGVVADIAVVKALRGPLEDQLTSALQAATERIRAGYAGEPVEQVCQRLLDETRAGLHPDIAAGFNPDMDEFCRVAVAIVRGTAV
ncbi:hypothetical protein D7147_04390 [Micromonospora musae]|uniref:Uncharacterized protein n=1 Tax=Micromonospora musae TaxID=1894970 RepID=A0A3A9XK69_9ACTN|nr:hypothetical protein D7147_04390 [Micromonospora musae]RKN25599.1 hypothetical protein D7044_31505 [Micromonospora musae]